MELILGIIVIVLFGFVWIYHLKWVNTLHKGLDLVVEWQEHLEEVQKKIMRVLIENAINDNTHDRQSIKELEEELKMLNKIEEEF